MQQLFKESQVPPYEICGRTVNILSELRSACERQETRTQHVLDDMKQKENEYNAEGPDRVLQIAYFLEFGIVTSNVVAN